MAVTSTDVLNISVKSLNLDFLRNSFDLGAHEPEILRYAINSICPIGADVRHLGKKVSTNLGAIQITTLDCKMTLDCKIPGIGAMGLKS